MPGFDATGPRGQGPGTGWGRGPCGAGCRRGAGRGRGMGAGTGGWPRWGRPRWGWGAWGYRGFRGRGFGPFGPGGAYGYEPPQQETQALKEEESYLRREIEALHQRIAQLEQQAGTE